MKICRVQESVVSTMKHPTYEGLSLYCVVEVDERGEDTGKEFVAVDRVQAGPGDVVLVMQEGNGVRQLFGVQDLPIRSIIVAIVDQVHVT
ncbi:MAG: EutN/CcmL family microcompartment protein [bacterium]